MKPVIPLSNIAVDPIPIVAIPDTNTLPFTVNLEVGFVVPIPKEPVEVLKDNVPEPVVTIPIELTPELAANVGNSVWAVCD